MSRFPASATLASCDDKSQLYLSGGGFRAALGSAGVVSYLIVQPPKGGGAASRWSNIREVISVSGASMLAGALAQSVPGDDHELCHDLGAFVRRLADDGARIRRSWRRIAATLFAIGSVCLSAWTLLAILGIVPLLGVGGRLMALFGLVALPLPIAACRLFLDVCLRDCVRVCLAPNRGASTGTRQFVFATVGLETGVRQFLAFGAGNEPGIDLADAVRASASLPGVGWLASARSTMREDLADAGVLGFFGSGYDAPNTSTRSNKLFVDARSSNQSSTALARWLRRSSLAANLGHWLRISLEASYQFERNTISSDSIVRLTTHAATDRVTKSADSQFEQRLVELRRRVGGVGLFGFTRAQAAVLVTAGVVSCAHELDGLDNSDEALDLLRRVERQIPLGLDLVRTWESTARAVSLPDAEGLTAMTHGGLADPLTQKHSAAAHRLAARSGKFSGHHIDTVLRRDGALISGHSMLSVGREKGAGPDLMDLYGCLLQDYEAERPRHINIEVKRRHTHDNVRAFLRELERDGHLGHVSVSAPFHTRFLRGIRDDFPALATNESLLEGALLGIPISLRRKTLRTEASGVQLHYWIARRSFLRQVALKRTGRLDVWGVNSISRAEKLIDTGITAMITDELSVAEFLRDLTASEAMRASHDMWSSVERPLGIQR